MAPRGGGAEGRPERADLYSMQQWCPLAGRRKYSALFFQVMDVSANESTPHHANDNDTHQLRAHATLTVQSPTRATTSTVPPRAST
jgi:hypothetical protein